MVEIRVTHEAGDEYRVVVRDAGGATEHRVTVTGRDLKRLAPGASVESLLQESFRFLLEREPKEAILRRFEIPVIARYFPEYPEEIRRRLGA
jgi:hypothetical protein